MSIELIFVLNLNLRSLSSKKVSSGSIPIFDKIGTTKSKILPFGKAIVNFLFKYIL